MPWRHHRTRALRRTARLLRSPLRGRPNYRSPRLRSTAGAPRPGASDGASRRKRSAKASAFLHDLEVFPTRAQGINPPDSLEGRCLSWGERRSMIENDPEHRRATERALFERYRAKRDPAVRDEIVERFFPLVRHLARRYAHAAEPMEDLLQVGALGLLKAISATTSTTDRRSRASPSRRFWARSGATSATAPGPCASRGGCRRSR